MKFLEKSGVFLTSDVNMSALTFINIVVTMIEKAPRFLLDELYEKKLISNSSKKKFENNIYCS